MKRTITVLLAVIVAGCATTRPNALGLKPVEKESSEVFFYTKYRAVSGKGCGISISVDDKSVGALSLNLLGPYLIHVLAPGEHVLLAKNTDPCSNARDNLPTSFTTKAGERLYIWVDDQGVKGRIMLSDQVGSAIVNEQQAASDLQQVLPIYRARMNGY